MCLYCMSVWACVCTCISLYACAPLWLPTQVYKCLCLLAGGVCHGILEKDLYCWAFGWFLVVAVKAGSGNQAGRWTSRKASLVVHGVENSKMAGDSGGFGNRITGGQGGAERSG